MALPTAHTTQELVMAYVLLAIALLLNALANTLLKIGASHLQGTADASIWLRLAGNPYLLFGLILFAVNVVFYVAALSRLQLSIASIYVMIRKGTLLAHRLGGRNGAIRIRPEDVESCLESTERHVTATKPARPSPRVKLKHIRL